MTRQLFIKGALVLQFLLYMSTGTAGMQQGLCSAIKIVGEDVSWQGLAKS